MDDEGARFFGPILVAKDFARTLGFYRRLLGEGFQGEHPYARYSVEGSTISIVDGRFWSQTNGPELPIQGESSVGNAVLAIRVPDIEEAFERLMAAGLKFLSPPTTRPPLGMRNMFLRDPDGRLVMLTAPMR